MLSFSLLDDGHTLGLAYLKTQSYRSLHPQRVKVLTCTAFMQLSLKYEPAERDKIESAEKTFFQAQKCVESEAKFGCLPHGK